jgi:hypothetical protein
MTGNIDRTQNEPIKRFFMLLLLLINRQRVRIGSTPSIVHPFPEKTMAKRPAAIVISSESRLRHIEAAIL